CAREATARAVGELSKRRAIGVVFAALAAVEATQAGRARADLSRARRAFADREWQFFSHLCGHVEALLAWQAGACSNAVALLRDTAARVHCIYLATLLSTAIELRQSRHTSAPRSHSTPAVPSGAEIELSKNSAISAVADGELPRPHWVRQASAHASGRSRSWQPRAKPP